MLLGYFYKSVTMLWVYCGFQTEIETETRSSSNTET